MLLQWEWDMIRTTAYDIPPIKLIIPAIEPALLRLSIIYPTHKNISRRLVRRILWKIRWRHYKRRLRVNRRLRCLGDQHLN